MNCYQSNYRICESHVCGTLVPPEKRISTEVKFRLRKAKNIRFFGSVISSVDIEITLLKLLVNPIQKGTTNAFLKENLEIFG